MPADIKKNGAAAPQEAQAAQPIRRRPERRVIPPVPILLDKERHLRMDFAAMDAFQEQTGLSAWDNETWNERSARTICALIWASLLHEDPDLTYEDVQRLPGMELANMNYLAACLSELWGVTMPKPEPATGAEATSDDPNPPARRTG